MLAKTKTRVDWLNAQFFYYNDSSTHTFWSQETYILRFDVTGKKTYKATRKNTATPQHITAMSHMFTLLPLLPYIDGEENAAKTVMLIIMMFST